jgi:hypothetical protein
MEVKKKLALQDWNDTFLPYVRFGLAGSAGVRGPERTNAFHRLRGCWSLGSLPARDGGLVELLQPLLSLTFGGEYAKSSAPLTWSLAVHLLRTQRVECSASLKPVQGRLGLQVACSAERRRHG